MASPAHQPPPPSIGSPPDHHHSPPILSDPGAIHEVTSISPPQRRTVPASSSRSVRRRPYLSSSSIRSPAQPTPNTRAMIHPRLYRRPSTVSYLSPAQPPIAASTLIRGPMPLHRRLHHRSSDESGEIGEERKKGGEEREEGQRHPGGPSGAPTTIVGERDIPRERTDERATGERKDERATPVAFRAGITISQMRRTRVGSTIK
ncbi:hypothetical protein U1Q18_001470 [Sarracenia purpurea var. burkii]